MYKMYVNAKSKVVYNPKNLEKPAARVQYFSIQCVVDQFSR